MKKAQFTMYAIMGLLIVVLAGLFVYNAISNQKASYTEQKGESASFNINKENFQEYFKECSKHSVLKANAEFGINDKSKTGYETYVSGAIESCMTPFLNKLRSQGFSITTGSVFAAATITDDMISVALKYPVELSKENEKFNFKDYTIGYPRKLYVDTTSLASQDLIVPSVDRRAISIIPKGTIITDSDGNEITGLSVNLIDKNFIAKDGTLLENSAVVGNLIYDFGGEKDIKFSNPVEMRFDLRGKDYPVELNEDSLAVSYLDKNNVWIGIDSKYDNGVLKAYTGHWTKFAVVMCGSNIELLPTTISNAYYLFAKEDDYFMKGKKIIVNQEMPVYNQPLADEKYLFGKEKKEDFLKKDYCTGKVWVEKNHESVCCCYKRDSSGDQEKFSSCILQKECNEEIIDLPTQIDNEIDKNVCFEEVKGYDDYHCLSHNIEDQDGDGYIYKIILSKKGNSCMRGPVTVKTYATSNDYGCKIMPSNKNDYVDSIIFSNKDIIEFNDKTIGFGIKSAKVTREKDLIIDGKKGSLDTSCTLLIGTDGLRIGKSTKYTQKCDKSEVDQRGFIRLASIDNSNNDYLCGTCTQIGEDYYYLPNDIPTVECCGPTNEGLAFCKGTIMSELGGKICSKDKDGKWRFVPWKQSGSDANRCNKCCSKECEEGKCQDLNCDGVKCRNPIIVLGSGDGDLI